MLRFLMILFALVAFTSAFDVAVEAQRGGRGGGGRGGMGRGGAGNWNKYKNKYKNKGKGPSEEEIKKLKEKYPETWEAELAKLKKKGKWGKRDVKADLIPAWKQQRLSTWLEACDTDQPLVLAFVAKKDELNSKYFVHEKAANASRKDVTFVWILEGQTQIVHKGTKEAERIKGFGEKKDEEEGEISEERKKQRELDAEIIARSRLASSDLWKEYEITKGNTFLICDKYGNEFKRYKSKPSGTTVLSGLKLIKSGTAKAEKAAAKALEKFNTAKEANNMDDMIRHAVDGINKFVGLPTVDALNEELEEILEEHDDALEEAVEAKNVSKLEELAKKFKGTRIAKTANATIEAIKGEEEAAKKKE